jgi:hypothetical protein
VRAPLLEGFGRRARHWKSYVNGHDGIFMELPIVPCHFTQAVGRLYRGGQKKPATIRIPTAETTIQVRLQQRMLDKDELMNRVQRGFKDLREAIYGG